MLFTFTKKTIFAEPSSPMEFLEYHNGNALSKFFVIRNSLPYFIYLHDDVSRFKTVFTLTFFQRNQLLQCMLFNTQNC